MTVSLLDTVALTLPRSSPEAEKNTGLVEFPTASDDRETPEIVVLAGNDISTEDGTVKVPGEVGAKHVKKPPRKVVP